MLQHATLELRREDEEGMAAFWELVGFERVEPPSGLVGRTAWFERAGTQIHLLWTDDPVAAPVGHVAVVVDDYDVLMSRVREGGYEVREGTPYWGAPRSFVRLPGGHLAELMSAPPPPQPSRRPGGSG